MEGKKNVLSRLLKVQQDLKAPKNQFNSFGKYNYRSCEDILQAARPLCNTNGLVLTLKDSVEAIGNRFYIKAEVTVTDVESNEFVTTQAYAREDDSKKGMDAAQVTGASSSYARKYSLCAMFAIDDTKDADSDEYTKQNARQNAQNGAGQAKNQPISDDEKKKNALKRVQDSAKKNSIPNDMVKAIISWEYDKESSKDLALNEACDLANNLLKYVNEMQNTSA